MKKSSFLILFFFVVLAVNSYAIGAGVGARSMAMGGTGIAIANDITSAYFNPAGIMFGPENLDIQVTGSGQTEGIKAMQDAILSGPNFITDNFDQAFNMNAGLSGMIGISMRRVGVSAIAVGNSNFNKTAYSLEPNFHASLTESIPLTLGSSFATPGLPVASMAFGVNLKSITEQSVDAGLIVINPTLGAGLMNISTGYGFGFDIGAQAKLTPLISVGAVVRNLSASVNRTTRKKAVWLDSTGETTEEDISEVKDVYSPKPETGIGVGIVIPITGTLIACDLENYCARSDPNDLKKYDSFTDTHIGIEQGMLFNAVMLRMGYYTDGPTEDTFYTYGLGFNLGPASAGIAAANSVEDSVNSIACAQLGMAF